MEGISNKAIVIFSAEKTGDEVKKNCWCFPLCLRDKIYKLPWYDDRISCGLSVNYNEHRSK